MNIKLIYQKIYFSPKEWLDLRSFFDSLNVNCFLLSKNSFFNFSKVLKFEFVGECIIVELNNNTCSLDLFDFFLNFIKKIQENYINKLFFIGFILNNSLFLTSSQIELYSNFLKKRIENNITNNFTISSIYLFNLLKILKVINESYILRLFVLKNKSKLHRFNYYY